MTKKLIHCGYVVGPQGEVLLQLPSAAGGFVIADDDQTWDFPPFKKWEAVADDDPRVTQADRDRLGAILAETRNRLFAIRLSALRTQAGLSVDDLARASGLSRQVLYRYEAGDREPGWAAVQALARALNCRTDDLRDDKS